MIEIIKEVLTTFNYRSLSDSDIQLFKSNTMDDYWVIYQGSPSQLLEKRTQSKLMAKCKKACSDPALEKNINIICLWCVDVIDKGTTRQLHQVEEDIYFFKKHVLYYTNNELASFTEQSSIQTLQGLLLNSPTSPDVFKRYKSSVNKGLWESLLYRVCIKLTFIPIAKESNDEMFNIYKQHNLTLSKKANKSHLEALDSIVLNLSEHDLNSESEQLLNLITSQLTECKK